MLGGLSEGHRGIIGDGPYGAFEQTVERLFGAMLRVDESKAQSFWGALANVNWFGPNGEEVAYSFRAAGDLLAAIRRDQGELAYMNYYCSSEDGCVPDWIGQPMADAGWRHEAGPTGQQPRST